MTYSYPSARGWGPGWPHCSESAWVAIDDVEYDGGKVTALSVARVRREIVDLVRLLIAETTSRGYDFKNGQCWGAVCRAVRGSTTTPSFHSWGLALDFNSAYNWLGRTDGGDIPGWMVQLWAQYGFFWGGNYSGRKDCMHFEYSRTPADAARDTARAKDEIGGDEMTPEEKATLKRAEAFLDAVTGPLQPGKDDATAGGAGSRVARSVLAFERDHEDPNGVDH